MLKIYIENELIDLFDDEVIELNSSVAISEDVSKVSSDYTKTFTVPASDNNNRLFRHYYNADIDNTFDARTKKECRIELDGMPFRTGKMRLEKVAVKNGAPSSYTMIFWGELVNLKTLIKEDMLSSLNLSAYNHNYTYANVLAGLTSGLYDSDIIYTLISSRRQFLYNSDPGDNTDTDTLVNIAYNGEDRGVIWNELTPSIRLYALIEAIEAKYSITFSRDFFGRNEFKELYLWLNNNEGDNYTPQRINWTSGNATEFGLNLTTDTWALNSFPDGFTNIKYRIEITPEPGYETVPYRIIVKNGDTVLSSTDATGAFTTSFISPVEPPFAITFNVAASASFEYEADLLMRGYLFAGTFDRAAHANTNIINDVFDVAAAIASIKTIDFLKALFNMYKLVAIPDSMGNVYVNTIDDYYLEGTVYDISKWVNWDSYDVERGKLLNTINFKYQPPTTILNMEFLKREGVAYGDAVTSLTDTGGPDGTPLDGDSLDISLPFEVMLFERLTNILNNDNTLIQYGLALDDKLSPANPKGVLHYNIRTPIAASPISLINQLGETVQINGTINTPAHTLGFDAPQFSMLWGEEFSTWDGQALYNTLYTNYWANYISALFNVKRRNFKFKAVLPTWLLTSLKLNDVLFIKDRYYRISDFTVNLTTREASFNLMNTFENNFGIFAPSQTRVLLDSQEQTYGVYVSNGTTMNIEKEDIGAGVSWATVTQSGSNISIAVTENTGDSRSLYINVDNGAGKSFQILLTQDEP